MNGDGLDLELIQQRVNAATPLYWEAHRFGDSYTSEVLRVSDDDNDPGFDIAAGVQLEADAEFIAHARLDVELLLGEVRRLRAVLSERVS